MGTLFKMKRKPVRIIDQPPRRRPPLHVTHGNVVVRFNVGVKLNMAQLVHDAPNMFGYILMAGMARLQTPHMNILIFSDGNCQLMSAVTMEHAECAISAFIVVLRLLGYDAAYPARLEVKNIMSRMSLGGAFDMDAFCKTYPTRATKIVGKFVGCRVRIPGTKVQVTVFYTGNVNLIGANSHEQSMKIMQEVAELCLPFVRY